MGSRFPGGDLPGSPFSSRPAAQYGNDMEALGRRIDLMETNLGRLAPKIDEMHAFLQASLPHLATKADVSDVRTDLAEKPGKTYIWTVLAVMVSVIFGAIALGVVVAPSALPHS